MSGYRDLLVYRLAVTIDDGTYLFCKKFLPDYADKRTVEQIIQASRSGKQNIVEGSLEKIALVLSEEKNIIGSTGFFVLRQKAYEPEVALVLLKSKPIQQLLKRQAQGTILTAIPKTSLPRVLLPKISQSVQGQVKQKIAQSNKERQEAKNLLEKAKQAVEIFIEQDEKQALAYLNK